MKSILFVCYLLLAIPIFSQDGYTSGYPRLAYWIVEGEPEVIIALHGGPAATHNYLRPEFDGLSDMGRLIYYDQRGCGMSESQEPYIWQDHVEDLDRIINQFSKGKKVFLTGSSWGSLLALLYAYAHPERVKGLILSAGLVKWRGKGMTEDLQADYSHNRRMDIEPKLIQLEDERILRWIDENGDTIIFVVPIKKDIILFRGAPQHETMSSMRTAPVLDSLQAIKLPVLIFDGAGTEFNPCRHSKYIRQYHQVLPNSEYYSIEGSCHDPWFSNPHTFQYLCKQFIERVSEGEPAQDP